MKDQCLPPDIISMVPRKIIETILTLMPIRDAVRTSILSKRWRYKWVKIPKLVLDLKKFEETVDDQMLKGYKSLYAINQVMLLHRGPILEFTLNWLESGNSFKIDQILLHLSRNNTLKKFILNAYKTYILPPSFYSLKQLTHLNLRNCELDPPSTFNGFKILESLSLDNVYIHEAMLLLFICRCPMLKHFAWLGFITISDIPQFFKFSTMIEHLELHLHRVMWSLTRWVPTRLLTKLVHLKHLDLSGSRLMGQREFSFTLLLIGSSPNLEKIKIEICQKSVVDFMKEITVFVVLHDYGDVRLDHLTEFEIKNYRNSTVELELLKLILVKSPVLKKVHLKLEDVESEKEEIKILRSFLRLPRASPVVEIIIQR